MGKGKRNRQLHFEDKQANPEKYQVKPRKNPKPLPKWVVPLVSILLVVVIVGAIVANIIINSGVIFRGRVLVESQSGEYDLNQQMAAFILWQNMYQSSYYEWYYTSWGMYEDTYGITKTYSSALDYGVNAATYYATQAMRDGIDSISDYLVELVAGADAGVKAGLVLDEQDEAEIASMMTWLDSVRSGCQFTFGYSMSKFLTECIGTGVKESDIEDASRLLAMYTKYSNYKKLDLDSDATVDLVNDFIVRNPSGMYKTSYRYFNTQDKILAEKLAACKTFDDFNSTAIDIVMNNKYKDLFNDQTAGKDANADKSKLNGKKGTELTAALTQLGITTSEIVKSNNSFDTSVKSWLFASARKDGDIGVVLGKNSAFLIYLEKAPAGTGDAAKVTAGWKSYSYSDYTAQGEGFEEQLKKDLLAGSTTFADSADKLAAAALKAFKDGTEKMPTDAVKVNTTKPLDKNDTNTAPTAILDVIYATGAKVEKGNFYQANNAGVSYVAEILSVDGTNFQIAYKAYNDTFYYSLFRAMKEYVEDVYPAAAQTLAHPETTTKDTVNEWLCESTFTAATDDTPASRVFARKKDDIKYFTTTKTGSDNKEITTYSVYIVTSPMTKNDSKEANVYGGYLQFEKLEDAQAALDSVKNKKGFDLWNAFGVLSTTTGEGEKAETVTATVETDIASSSISDDNLKKWLFDSARKTDDTALIDANTGYYVAYYITSDEEWFREGKDKWISHELSENMKQLVEDGNYKMDEKILDKLGDPTPVENNTTTAGGTTTEATTTTGAAA